LSFKFQNKFVFVENSAVELHTGRAWVPPELSEKRFSFIRGWASTKPPHSGRRAFQLVPQPENPFVSLSPPFAPATMLGLAALALRVWTSANGRPLHSRRCRLRDEPSRPHACRVCNTPSPTAIMHVCHVSWSSVQ